MRDTAPAAPPAKQKTPSVILRRDLVSLNHVLVLPTVCPTKLRTPSARPSANSPGPWIRPCGEEKLEMQVSVARQI